MFLNSLPNSAPLFSLSAFLMEVSLYTSSTTSVHPELDPSRSAKPSRESATLTNVLWSPLSLCMRVIASITHADGCGTMSAAGTHFCISFAKAALFVFLHQQWITPREGALVDDLELPSFEVFCFQLLISSGQIDFYQLSDNLFGHFVLDMHLFVQLGNCLQLCFGDCVVELDLRWL